mmetsp:Transcript_33951/g.47036  ORF Transcript_33951/g.47036 Transcript_33951/m.47036 type:complete len:170 (-) Transcript_33951:93-602(-)
MYHEKQQLLLCLRHCLNNISQEFTFSTKELTGIADELQKIDGCSHCAVFFGNFDANVLELALLRRGLEMAWFDKRADFSTLDLSNVWALVLNIETWWPYNWLGIPGRHWVGLREVDGVWYNLDSKLESPVPFENRDELWRFLGDSIRLHKGTSRLGATFSVRFVSCILI